MKQVATSLLVVLGLVLSALAGQAQQPHTHPVIVVFADGASLGQFAGSYQPDSRAVDNSAGWDYLDRGVAGAVQDVERRHGFSSDYVYSAALRGFAAPLTAQQVAALQDDPRVAYVEADRALVAGAQILPWGINRIDADLSSTLAGNGMSAVSNVNVYVIDTGIDTRHADLNVIEHVNFAGGSNTDCHGHGTHVAGIVAARDNDIDVVGVAPGARLHGVKVLSCDGAGSVSTVIKGVDWVTAHAVRPAIANMSLGGAASIALDAAVIRSADSGVFYSIAAGNRGVDACNSSPARAGTHDGVMTVAAATGTGEEASWSNFGRCVDIWAPGVSVLSTKLNGGTTSMSGTSMAGPHAGGTGALYLSTHPGANAATVESELKASGVWTGASSKDGRSIKLVYAGTF